MKGYFINPKDKTIKETILYHNTENGISNLIDTIKLILEVDFIEKLWYNNNYSLYYQKQDNLSKQKELCWFEIKGTKETKIIFGSALMVPHILEDKKSFNITFLDDYEPPTQDFIL